MTTGFVGTERVRSDPHRRARSASQCGVSHGPRACRVRVPINLQISAPHGRELGVLSGSGILNLRDLLKLRQNLTVFLS